MQKFNALDAYLTCLCDGCVNYRKEKGIPEPDPNRLYNSTVREIAEELATVKCLELKQATFVDDYMQQARAMVAKISSEVRQALYSKGIPNRRQYLIERGLIPAKPEDNATEGTANET